jgi:iron complex transport system ATP-binding protein
MDRNKSILSVKNLSFSYNGKKVLDNISFDVERGSFISILGPNGAGKSTIVKLISGIKCGYEGKIKLEGRDIKKMGSGEIAKTVGVVPQYTNPGFDFTVGEMVMMGRHAYISRFEAEKKEDFAKVDEAMEKAEILSFAKRKFSELSGGEKQRVVVAQALAQDSPLLFLDEPTSHLDINFQIEFMNLFMELNRRGNKTIIGIFHDINLAFQSCGEILLLKEGKIYGSGRAEDILNRASIKNVFGSDVFVGRNPVTGKFYISPIFNPEIDWEMAGKPGKKDVKVHVIGGGGAASAVITLLYNNGYKVSCGVVNTLDSDMDTARMLEIPYVAEAPFSPISPDSQEKNLQFIKSSDVVVLPCVEFGPGNLSNLVSVKKAVKLNKKVIIIDEKHIIDRDHTGGRALEFYNEIIGGGAVVAKTAGRILRYLQ